MDTRSPYYSHSGAVGLTGPLTMLAVGSLGGALLGGLYGHVITVIPLVYVNFVFTILLGTTLGRLAGLGARLGHVRNRFYAAWLSGLCALLAFYCSWITWLHAVYDDQTWILRPEGIITAASEILPVGAWSMHGLTPTGWGLGLIWLVEAVLIVGGAVLFVSRSIQDTPFCESCGCWLQTRRMISPLRSVPRNKRRALRHALEQGDFTMLTSLELVPRDKKVYSELQLLSCPRCDAMHTLTLTAVLATDRSREPSREPLIHNLLIDRAAAEDLVGRWQRLEIELPSEHASGNHEDQVSTGDA